METRTPTSGVPSQGGHMTPPGAGLTSDALPEAQSTISAESSQAGCPPEMCFRQTPLHRRNRKTICTGTPCEPPTEGKEKPTTTSEARTSRPSTPL